MVIVHTTDWFSATLSVPEAGVAGESNVSVPVGLVHAEALLLLLLLFV